MSQALLIVKHSVNDFSGFRSGYDNVQSMRDSGGVTAEEVLQDPADPNTVTVLHWFSSLEQAEAFVGNPGLKDAMAAAGVNAPPRIEIVVGA
jgi:hypothetical protein